MSYGKIFESLFTGSMVGSGATVFAVWAYCIAHAKPPGFIELNPRIMATIIGCSVEDVNAAIATLSSPDPNSRSKECEGRRLVPQGSFLYQMPTWPKYNQLRNEAERREQNRLAQERWRNRNKPSVSASKQSKPMKMQMQMDTPEVPEEKAPRSARQPLVPRPEAVPQDVWDAWVAVRKRKLTALAWAAVEREAGKAGWSIPDVVRKMAERGWQSVEAAWLLKESGGSQRAGAPRQKFWETPVEMRDLNAEYEDKP